MVTRFYFGAEGDSRARVTFSGPATREANTARSSMASWKRRRTVPECATNGSAPMPKGSNSMDFGPSINLGLRPGPNRFPGCRMEGSKWSCIESRSQEPLGDVISNSASVDTRSAWIVFFCTYFFHGPQKTYIGLVARMSRNQNPGR